MKNREGLLTRWELAYGIFVLRFRPKKQQFSVVLHSWRHSHKNRTSQAKHFFSSAIY